MNTTHIRSAAPAGLRGFTLIEILIAFTIMAVLMGVGIPSLVETLRANRLTAKSNDLVQALTLARSEAMKRRVPVSVCARDGNACAAAATAKDWSGGWLVFTDDLAPLGKVDAPTDVVLLSSPPGESLVSITSTADTLTYEPRGVRTAITLTVVDASGCKDKKREISVELTGRVSLAKKACS